MLGQWFFQQILGLDELYLRMKQESPKGDF